MEADAARRAVSARPSPVWWPAWALVRHGPGRPSGRVLQVREARVVRGSQKLHAEHLASAGCCALGRHLMASSLRPRGCEKTPGGTSAAPVPRGVGRAAAASAFCCSGLCRVGVDQQGVGVRWHRPGVLQGRRSAGVSPPSRCDRDGFGGGLGVVGRPQVEGRDAHDPAGQVPSCAYCRLARACRAARSRCNGQVDVAAVRRVGSRTDRPSLAAACRPSARIGHPLPQGERLVVVPVRSAGAPRRRLSPARMEAANAQGMSWWPGSAGPVGGRYGMAAGALLSDSSALIVQCSCAPRRQQVAVDGIDAEGIAGKRSPRAVGQEELVVTASRNGGLYRRHQAARPGQARRRPCGGHRGPRGAPLGGVESCPRG